MVLRIPSSLMALNARIWMGIPGPLKSKVGDPELLRHLPFISNTGHANPFIWEKYLDIKHRYSTVVEINVQT
jgi:hypothetical protein